MSENTESQTSGTPVRTSARATSANLTGTMPPSVPPASAETNVSAKTTAAPPSSTPVKTAGKQGPGAPQPKQPKKPAPGPRRVRLAVSRIDPWSAMKLAFLLAIAAGIALVAATSVVWWVLNSMGVFGDIRSVIEEAEAMVQFGKILEYFEFSRVISVATVIAVVDIVLWTALATLGAFIYNIVAAMVGGLHLTLTDE